MTNITLDKVTKGRKKRPPRIILSGTNGVGKSTWASQMPNPLFIDIERGTNALDVDRLYADTEADVLDICHELLEAKHDYKSLVIDSLDWLETLLQRSVVQQFSKKKEGIQDISDIEYGRGYMHTLKKLNATLDLFDELVNKNNMLICLICHTHVVNRQDPLLDPYDKIELKTHAKFGARVKEWCDFLLFANYDVRTVQRGEGFKKRNVAIGDESRILYTRGSTAFDAKCRLPIVDPKTGRYELELNFKAFYAAYKAAFADPTTKAKETKDGKD